MIEKRDYFEPAIRIYYYIAFEPPFEIPVEVPVAAWTHNWRTLGGGKGTSPWDRGGMLYKIGDLS